jgi:signal transduction histidine kinase
MTVAAGLAPGQLRAVGLTIGALYAFHVVRAILTDLFVSGFNPTQGAVNFLAWVPGVVALACFLAKRVQLGQLWLATAGICYPIAVGMWPFVVGAGTHPRADFWIHQIPGLAAVAMLMTMRLWIATASLFVYCLEVEVVMRSIGVITEWRDTLVRAMFSIVYSAFFFILLLALIRTMESTKRVLDRSAWERTQAGMMRARADEIGRLDRLTHDFILSLLSSAAEGAPPERLQIQAETVRHQLESGFPQSEEDSTLAEVAGRIVRRGKRRGLSVGLVGTDRVGLIPRGTAAEIEAAVDEAIRNALGHAERGQRMLVTLGRESLLVRVLDDGPGFPMERLGDRLGVRQSILQRMNSLPGGQASIDSTPGRGTVVTIGWRMP